MKLILALAKLRQKSPRSQSQILWPPLRAAYQQKAERFKGRKKEFPSCQEFRERGGLGFHLERNTCKEKSFLLSL